MQLTYLLTYVSDLENSQFATVRFLCLFWSLRHTHTAVVCK